MLEIKKKRTIQEMFGSDRAINYNTLNSSSKYK